MAYRRIFVHTPTYLVGLFAIACANAVTDYEDEEGQCLSSNEPGCGSDGSGGGAPIIEDGSGGFVPASGGALSTGGILNTGGTAAAGGSGGDLMTSGGASTGGAASGGESSAGGSIGAGGSLSTGGAAGAGGASSGGASGVGGSVGSECEVPAFSDSATYAAGDQVEAEGGVYECKPHPYTGWCSTPGYDPATSLYWEQAWDYLGLCDDGGGAGGSGSGGAGSGGSGSGGASGSGGSSGSDCVLDDLLGEEKFLDWYSERRNPFYTYDQLCTALETFPEFAATGSDSDRKREVAAFFAHVSRETGELEYIEQIAKDPPTYFGRGPLQLTHDYNYEDAGDFLDVNLMGANADLLATDGVLTWEASLWFWMERDAGQGTCHEAITEGSGFGLTIDIINGGFECNGSNGPANERISYYQTYSASLGVDPGGNLTCW